MAENSSKKRRTLSLQLKLEAVEYSKRVNNSAAAQKFKVGRNQIVLWRKNEAKMKAELSGGKKSSKSQRLSGGGRTQLAAAVNDRVRQWVLNMRERRKCVSRRLIRLEAMKIASELVEAGKLEANKFTASLGWLEKFLRRNNFSLRATTTTCQKPPADYVPKIIDFVLFLRTQRQQHKYTDANILACDETAVWLDPIGKNCITTKGAKDVIVQTLGHEKVHVTVMLCKSERNEGEALCSPTKKAPCSCNRAKVWRDVDPELGRKSLDG